MHTYFFCFCSIVAAFFFSSFVLYFEQHQSTKSAHSRQPPALKWSFKCYSVWVFILSRDHPTQKKWASVPLCFLLGFNRAAYKLQTASHVGLKLQRETPDKVRMFNRHAHMWWGSPLFFTCSKLCSGYSIDVLSVVTCAACFTCDSTTRFLHAIFTLNVLQKILFHRVFLFFSHVKHISHHTVLISTCKPRFHTAETFVCTCCHTCCPCWCTA